MSLTIPLAVEKVLFRLALQEGGYVTLARLFLELPLSLEEVEEYADKVVNGYSVRKDEFGEFLAYEFPELQRQMPPATIGDCPGCGGKAPPAPTEGGVEVRAPALCQRCYDKVKGLARHQPDEGVVTKLKSFFKGEEEEDLRKVAEAEHEIFYLGLRLGLEQFTHTTIAAQSRLPSQALKQRLDRMGGRRYIHAGLLPSGDAVAYRFPRGLTYPEPHYDRFKERKIKSADVEIEATARGEPRAPLIGRLEPKKPELKITIKGRRDRG